MLIFRSRKGCFTGKTNEVKTQRYRQNGKRGNQRDNECVIDAGFQKNPSFQKRIKLR